MDVSLLKTLVSTPGISGREERIRDVVKKELENLVDEVEVDRLGNLIGKRAGSHPKVMLCAHMDSIGFLVRHIDDNGFLRLSRVGGFDPRTLVMQRVLVQGKKDYVGVVSPEEKPIHLQERTDREKALKLEDLFVDLRLPAEEVKENVSIGDAVSLYREAEVSDSSFTSPYLDDRLGVYNLVESLRRAQTQCEVLAVVSVQEEVGLRGARTSAFGLDPDVGIALDITIATDIPGIKEHDQTCSMRGGVALSVMDEDSISDSRLVRSFKDLAEANNIKHQMEILLGGGTDAGAIQLARAGAPVMTISTPVRYVHTVNESAAISDIDATVDLMVAFLETAHDLKLDW